MEKKSKAMFKKTVKFVDLMSSCRRTVYSLPMTFTAKTMDKLDVKIERALVRFCKENHWNPEYTDIHTVEYVYVTRSGKIKNI